MIFQNKLIDFVVCNGSKKNDIDFTKSVKYGPDSALYLPAYSIWDLARNFMTSPNDTNLFPGHYVYFALAQERKRTTKD